MPHPQRGRGRGVGLAAAIKRQTGSDNCDFRNIYGHFGLDRSCDQTARAQRAATSLGIIFQVCRGVVVGQTYTWDEAMAAIGATGNKVAVVRPRAGETALFVTERHHTYTSPIKDSVLWMEGRLVAAGVNAHLRASAERGEVVCLFYRREMKDDFTYRGRVSFQDDEPLSQGLYFFFALEES